MGSPRGIGECGFCGSLDRNLCLALWPQTINSGTVRESFTASNAHDCLPVGREKLVVFSLSAIENSAEFPMGTWDAKGSVSIVSMVTVFLTSGVPSKYRHYRHDRHDEGWMRINAMIRPPWVRLFWYSIPYSFSSRDLLILR